MFPITRKLLTLFRRTVQTCESIIAYPLSLPFIMIGWFSILLGRYTDSSLLVSFVPFYLGERVRYLYYKATLKRLGKDVTFKFGSFCQYRSTCIGERVLIGYYNVLGWVNIGSDVLVGCNVNFTSGLKHHAFDDPDKTIVEQPATGPVEIQIGSDVWIGNNALICADIGNRCVIGAGSVLVKPALSHSLYAGNPARLIREIV